METRKILTAKLLNDYWAEVLYFYIIDNPSEKWDYFLMVRVLSRRRSFWDDIFLN